jgi:hypothetical protein
MEGSERIKHMSVKELRKAVTALRKTGCPAVSRMKKAQLLVEMTVHTAANKMRATAKPVEMERRGKKSHKAAAVEQPSDKIELEASLYKYQPSGMTAKKYKGMEPTEALKMFIKQQQDKKVDRDLGEFISYNYTAPEELRKSTDDIKEELEDAELQIADFNDNPDPAYKKENDEMVRKVEIFKKILAIRGVGAPAAAAAKKKKSKK